MLISCFSFTEVAKEAAPLMKKGGSMITLTYESTKTIPNYNVMGVCKSALETSTKYLARDLGKNGIRVNAISAGPIKTLAASAIGDAKFLYKWNEDHSFLKRNVDINDVGNSALYLLSDLAGGVTGEIHYVDALVITKLECQIQKHENCLNRKYSLHIKSLSIFKIL